MSAKKHERRAVVPRILQAVTVETRPQPHASGMNERTADMLQSTQRLHLLSGNFPQALATAFERIAEHLGQDTGDLMDTPLLALKLPETILGPLESEGVNTIADTLTLSDMQLLAVPRFGAYGLRELRATVRAFIREKAAQLARVVDKPSLPEGLPTSGQTLSVNV